MTPQPLAVERPALSLRFATAPRAKLRAYVELARPLHGVKNLLVLLPWAMGAFAVSAAAPLATLAVFWLCAMAVYALNDALDAFHDMYHPTKRERPVASQRLTEGEAFAFAAMTFGLAVALALALAPAALPFAIAYLVINVFYSSVAKEVAVADVIAVASGFVLRFLAGATVIGAAGEHLWALPALFVAASALAVGKRFAKQRAGAAVGAPTRIPARYTADNLSGALLVLSHVGVLLAAWLLVGPGAEGSAATALSAPARVLLALGAALVLSRVVFLMLRRAMEPTAAFVRDQATLVGSTLLGLVLVGDALL